jgi:hypothetical protein
MLTTNRQQNNQLHTINNATQTISRSFHIIRWCSSGSNRVICHSASQWCQDASTIHCRCVTSDVTGFTNVGRNETTVTRSTRFVTQKNGEKTNQCDVIGMDGTLPTRVSTWIHWVRQYVRYPHQPKSRRNCHYQKRSATCIQENPHDRRPIGPDCRNQHLGCFCSQKLDVSLSVNA